MMQADLRRNQSLVLAEDVDLRSGRHVQDVEAVPMPSCKFRGPLSGDQSGLVVTDSRMVFNTRDFSHAFSIGPHGRFIFAMRR
jgi:hypothetical protein